MRDVPAGGVTAEPAEGFVAVQFGDELAGVRAVEDAFGREGMGEGEAGLGRRPVLALAVRRRLNGMRAAAARKRASWRLRGPSTGSRRERVPTGGRGRIATDE